jgi:hypothetical protein
MDSVGKVQNVLEDRIQALVNRAQNNAVDNGYKEYVLTENPAALAIDMVDYDSDIAKLVEEEFFGDEEGLIPYIKVWQVAQCTA